MAKKTFKKILSKNTITQNKSDAESVVSRMINQDVDKRRKPKEERKEERKLICLTKNTREHLEALALMKKTSVNEVINEAINLFIDKRRKEISDFMSYMKRYDNV